MAFYAAKAVHQVFRDHEEIGNALQSSGYLVRIELIDGIEGLELDASMPVQAGETDLFMHLRDHFSVRLSR